MKCPVCSNPRLDRIKARRRGIGAFVWWCWKCEKTYGPAPSILSEKTPEEGANSA